MGCFGGEAESLGGCGATFGAGWAAFDGGGTFGGGAVAFGGGETLVGIAGTVAGAAVEVVTEGAGGLTRAGGLRLLLPPFFLRFMLG